MVAQRAEIEECITESLLEHPELYNMSLHDVLINLDDGTE